MKDDEKSETENETQRPNEAPPPPGVEADQIEKGGKEEDPDTSEEETQEFETEVADEDVSPDEDKKDDQKKDSEKNGKISKFSLIAGIVGIGILLFRIAVDILVWFLPLVGCFTCFIRPIFALGFIGAVIAIVLGIIGIVSGKEENKTSAFIGIGLGVAYFILGIGWWIFYLFI